MFDLAHNVKLLKRSGKTILAKHWRGRYTIDIRISSFNREIVLVGKFTLGSLARAFKNAAGLDDAGKRQFKAGLAAVGVGYAAVGAVCAIEPAAAYMLIEKFSFAHVPLHTAFAMATGLAGAAGMAAYDHLTGRKEQPDTEKAEASAPTLKP